MGTKVNIMDMQVDLLTKETLKQEMQNFLENETVNVAHVISLDYMDAYDKNELVRESLAHADLVLPGEKAILTRHHVDVLETGGMAVDYHAELELLSLANENNRTIYLVLRSEKEAKMVYRFLSEYIDRDQIVGIYVADGEVAEESLINDINMKLPDIVLLSMESTEQEEWLENNREGEYQTLCGDRKCDAAFVPGKCAGAEMAEKTTSGRCLPLVFGDAVFPFAKKAYIS